MPVTFDIARPGPLAFPITPFHSDRSLDLPRFRRHLRWLLDHEPPALFVACGTGEFASLDVDEVGALVRAAVEMAGSEVPIYAGAGQGLPLARRYVRAAEDAGARGILLLPPYLVAGEQEGLAAYVREVAAATSLPLILYQRSTAVYEPDTVAELATIANVVGFKDGLGDVERMQRIVARVGDELTMFNGLPTAETYQAAYAAMGVHLYSSAVFNFVPEISWAFSSAIRNRDAEAAQLLLREFFVPLTELRRRVRGYAVSLMKAGAAMRSSESAGPVRPPLVEVSEAHRRELAAIVDRAAEFSAWGVPSARGG